MRWLNQLWQLIRDVALTGLGGYVIWKQAVAAHPEPGLIFAGLALLTPAGHAAWQQLSGSGSPSPPSPPEPPEPSPLSSGHTGES